jgi:hypothetical protein
MLFAGTCEHPSAKKQKQTWYPCSPGALYGTRGTFPPPMRNALSAGHPPRAPVTRAADKGDAIIPVSSSKSKSVRESTIDVLRSTCKILCRVCIPGVTPSGRTDTCLRVGHGTQAEVVLRPHNLIVHRHIRADIDPFAATQHILQGEVAGGLSRDARQPQAPYDPSNSSGLREAREVKKLRADGGDGTYPGAAC